MKAPLGSEQMKGITQDEISKLTKAMKSSEFRDHMDEYCKEISDPAHRKEYLQYLDHLEASGDMPEGQQLLRTQPGCCIKTSVAFKSGQTQKFFINIVHSDRLHDMEMLPAEKGEGRRVHLPYSLSPPRPDRDHKGEYCMTCDFAISTSTFGQAMQNPNILKFLVDTAADGMASRFLKGHEEVNKDWKLMRRQSCKGGAPMPMSVKAELLRDKGTKATPAKKLQGDAVTPAELKQLRKDAKDKKSKEAAAAAEEEEEEEKAAALKLRVQAEQQQAAAPRIRVPQHKLLHSGTIDFTDFMESNHQPMAPLTTVPKLLKLTVELPTVKRSSDVSLEVTSNNVVVEVEGKYYLDLPLSYEIEESDGVAKFDKAKQVLSLELPVKPKMANLEAAAALGAIDPVTTRGSGHAEDGGLSEGHESSEEEPFPPAVEDRCNKERLDPAIEGATEPGQQAGLASAEPPPLPSQPKLERLELEPRGSALNIAESAPAPPAGHLPGEEVGMEVLEEAQDVAELPGFIASDSFAGRRPGYYFSTGAQGLGYYLDSRQPRPKRPGPAPVLAPASAVSPSEARPSSEPLVTEVEPSLAAVPPELAREPLPASMQRYVEATSAMATRIAAADSQSREIQGELPLEWSQTRQNVMIFVDIPLEHEVADVQLRLAGQHLTVTFCTRPLAAGMHAGAARDSGPAVWQRHRLRRTLCGLVDPRQWHAELTAGDSGGSQLALVLRKAGRAELWAEVVDAAAVPCEPCDDGAAALKEEAAQAGGAAGNAAAAAAAAKEEDAGSAREGAGSAVDEAAVVEDSAELDATVPLSHGEAAAGALTQPAAAVAPLQGKAQESLIQSATAMGQSVLLRSRLMYMLL